MPRIAERPRFCARCFDPTEVGLSTTAMPRGMRARLELGIWSFLGAWKLENLELAAGRPRDTMFQPTDSFQGGMMSKFILALVACLAMPACIGAQEPPLERIQATIAGRVEQLLACRQPDGSFVLGKPEAQLGDLYAQFPMGQTALAVLALQYARPHLKGELRTRAGPGRLPA